FQRSGWCSPPGAHFLMSFQLNTFHEDTKPGNPITLMSLASRIAGSRALRPRREASYRLAKSQVPCTLWSFYCQVLTLVTLWPLRALTIECLKGEIGLLSRALSRTHRPPANSI